MSSGAAMALVSDVMWLALGGCATVPTQPMAAGDTRTPRTDVGEGTGGTACEKSPLLKIS